MGDSPASFGHDLPTPHGTSSKTFPPTSPFSGWEPPATARQHPEVFSVISPLKSFFVAMALFRRGDCNARHRKRWTVFR